MSAEVVNTDVPSTDVSSSSRQRVRSATVGATLKRWSYWAGIATVALIVVFAGIVVRGTSANQDYLSPTTAGPVGAKAVVEVLRQQGVDVTITTSLTDTLDALADDATLVFFERDVFLDDDQRDDLFDAASDLVLLNPGFDDLDRIAQGVAPAGVVDRTVLDAACSLPLASTAPRVLGGTNGYRILDVDGESAIGCYPSGDDTFSLVRIDAGDRTVTVVGATDALTNEHVLTADNAAFALNVLGEAPALVWYIPGTDDLPEAPATVSELSPPWVLPSVLLVVLTLLAAAFWRGRRFGPLIIENLPVTVKASETMQGRARLYASSSARLRALDSLRIGTVSRLASLCGMPRAATVEEIVNAAAAVSGRDPRAVRALVLDAQPQSDRELVALSDDLLELEHTVAERIRAT
ncbi:MAG: DUF4350 domain-containing protein [Microbacteriaceae bacterium]